MTTAALNIVYEDNHLLVLNKPAGLATMGLPDGEATMLTLAKEYIKRKYQKPGNVYLGVVSRLDAPVTGIVLLARTSKAAARLSEQFRTREVDKTYWALIEPSSEPASGGYTDWLVHDDRHRRVHVVGSEQSSGRESRLSYRRTGGDDRFWLLEIKLETGRKHQIRVQMAHHGQPIVGDRKYGSALKFPAGIALHARRLTIAHPVGGGTLEFVAPLPKYWPRAFQ